MCQLKIVSGAQAGVDRAALDAAIELGIQYGGWVPSGRKAEDGKIPEKYACLQETKSAGYQLRTKLNVVDSDATLIIVKSSLTPGSAMTLKMAADAKRPCFVASLQDREVLQKTASWLQSQVKDDEGLVLNVAGSRESKSPGIYSEAKALLVKVLKQLIWCLDCQESEDDEEAEKRWQEAQFQSN